MSNPDGTPSCCLCGEKCIGLGEDALMLIRGMWMPDNEHDAAAFLVDPDTELHIEALPTDQLMFFSDTQGYPTQHAHLDCMRTVVNDLRFDWIEDEEMTEDELEEEENDL